MNDLNDTLKEETLSGETASDANEPAGEEKKKGGITADMVVTDIITQYPDAVYPLMEIGMGCVACPASLGETLAEAAVVHGFDPQDVLNYVNDRLGFEVDE